MNEQPIVTQADLQRSINTWLDEIERLTTRQREILKRVDAATEERREATGEAAITAALRKSDLVEAECVACSRTLARMVPSMVGYVRSGVKRLAEAGLRESTERAEGSPGAQLLETSTESGSIPTEKTV